MNTFYSKKTHYHAIISTVLGGAFLFGFASSCIAGALAALEKAFSLTPVLQGILVGMALFGASMGSLVAGLICDIWGRKKALGLLAILFLVGFIYGGLSRNITDLFLSRFIVGLGMGLASVSVPLYLAETAPHLKRGKYVSLNQLTITIGILFGYLVAMIFQGDSSWRWILSIGSLVPIFILFTLSRVPETPGWLLSHKTTLDAQKIHDMLPHDAKEKMHPIRKEKKWAISSIFSKKNIPLVAIAFTLSIFQQITGINAIIYYAPNVFGLAKLDPTSSAFTASIGIGIVNIMATIFSMAIIDKIGRKKLLLLGSFGMMGSLLLGVFSLTFSWKAALVFSLFLFVISFAIGLGVATWVVISEILPLKIRATGMSLGFLINWVANCVVAVSFPIFVAKYNLAVMLGVFSFLSLLAAIFIQVFIKETKGKPLEEFM